MFRMYICPTQFWQRSTSVLIDWVAYRTLQIHSKWHTQPLNYHVIFTASFTNQATGRSLDTPTLMSLYNLFSRHPNAVRSLVFSGTLKQNTIPIFRRFQLFSFVLIKFQILTPTKRHEVFFYTDQLHQNDTKYRTYRRYQYAGSRSYKFHFIQLLRLSRSFSSSFSLH